MAGGYAVANIDRGAGRHLFDRWRDSRRWPDCVEQLCETHTAFRQLLALQLILAFPIGGAVAEMYQPLIVVGSGERQPGKCLVRGPHAVARPSGREIINRLSRRRDQSRSPDHVDIGTVPDVVRDLVPFGVQGLVAILVVILETIPDEVAARSLRNGI